MVPLPSQRRPLRDPERQTLVVDGSTGALGSAMQHAAEQGWDTCAVTRHGASSWQLTVQRRR